MLLLLLYFFCTEDPFPTRSDSRISMVVSCSEIKNNFCRDGQSRGGVYCAANACIEQVIQHGEVDVFQAVKTVRRHRPQLVENIVRQLLYAYFIFHVQSNLDIVNTICSSILFTVSRDKF